jgi:uncharacterized membrane-anchored protein
MDVRYGTVPQPQVGHPMSRVYVWLTTALLFLSGTFADAQQLDDSPPGRDPQATEIAHMNWRHDGKLDLPFSQSSIALPVGFHAVTGTDANRLVEISNGHPDNNAEAYLIDQSNRSEVLLEYIDSGYVTLDDLSELDSEKLLAQIRDATEESNAARRKANVPEMHVRGWLQQPTFDRAANTAYWALAATSGQNGLVNAIALRLGRNGYEKFTWIVQPDKFAYVGSTLDVVLRAHSFNSGARYADHVNTDKFAGYGIAALIGVAAGAKIAKVAAAGGLLLLLKKAWFVPLLLLGALWRKVKQLFGRRPAANS